MPSNVENILNAILTGDGSGIQKPASRVEELLFEIYEQGGGGGGESVIGGIKLTIDENYVLTATLVDKDGEEYGVGDDIDLPLEEMVVDAEYDPQTQKIKLELKNGNYVEFSVAELVSGLQTELSSSNKLNPAYIDYDASHRAVSDTEKNTWNAKQTAISDLDTIRSGAAAGATAVQPSALETALAGKQDSLDNAQLAAVNSGIDSTKVAQIETNQTNILLVQDATDELVNDGVKNKFNFDAWAYNVPVVYGTKVVNGNSITLTPNGSQQAFTDVVPGRYPVAAQIPVTTGDKMVATWDYTTEGTDVSGSVGLFGNGGYSQYKSAQLATKYLEFTIPAGVTYVALRVVCDNPNTSITFSNLMVTTKAMYDISPTYEPYALPNTDLTVLEAEDRAALAEVVDSGAKNIVDISKAYASDYGNVSIDANTNSVTVSGTHAWAKGNIVVSVKPNTTYAIKYRISANTSTVQSSLTVTKGDTSDTYYSHIIASGTTGTFTGEFTTDANASIAVVKITANSTGSEIVTAASITISELMVCTLAGWKISPKFVPYRKNLDQLDSTKAPVLSTITMDSGSLDDITTNSFIVCSWEVASKPISTMGFVRTSVFDANSALQEFYSFSADETQSRLVYVRDKQAGVWRSWKLLTNNT